MRLFIAVNFNDDTKARLIKLQDELRAKSSGGSFPPIENMHLTLVFIGECDENQSSVIKSVMNTVHFEPFEIFIDRIGNFRRDGGDLWWAGVREDEQLIRLQRQLANTLILKGFDIEARKYSPHITLGRRVKTTEKAWQIEGFGENVYGFELMKSILKNGKNVYISMHEIHG